MNPARVIGHDFADRYTVTAAIGSGGMGAVYRAHDRRLDRAVALKTCPDHPPDLAARFRREAQTLAGLDHPNLITVFDLGHDADLGLLWMAQPLINGLSLADALRTSGPLPPARAAHIGRAVLDGLDCAHRAGLVHRDVKPGNIMLHRGVDGAERVTLIDFGVARPVDDPDPLTASGLVMGTPAYMAPEQIRQGVVAPSIDLYALGATLYAAVAGHPPFRAPTTLEVARQHLEADVPPLPQRVPRGLADAITRALRKDPGVRPDAAELRALLSPAAPLPPTQPLPATEPAHVSGELVSEPAPPRRAPVGLAFVAGVATAVAISVMIWPSASHRAPSPPAPPAAAVPEEPTPLERFDRALADCDCESADALAGDVELDIRRTRELAKRCHLAQGACRPKAGSE